MAFPASLLMEAESRGIEMPAYLCEYALCDLCSRG